MWSIFIMCSVNHVSCVHSRRHLRCSWILSVLFKWKQLRCSEVLSVPFKCLLCTLQDKSKIFLDLCSVYIINVLFTFQERNEVFLHNVLCTLENLEFPEHGDGEPLTKFLTASGIELSLMTLQFFVTQFNERKEWVVMIVKGRRGLSITVYFMWQFIS